MWTRATLSIMGLYQVRSDIFDGLALPASTAYPEYGVTTEAVEPGILLGLLLAECADLEVLHPDPDIMKKLIELWSISRLDEWKKLNLSVSLAYNPIHNYDRTEEWTENVTGTRTDSSRENINGTRSDSSTENGTNSQTVTGKSSTARSGTSSGAEKETSVRDTSGAETITTSGTDKKTITTDGTQKTDSDTAGFNSGSLVPNAEVNGIVHNVTEETNTSAGNESNEKTGSESGERSLTISRTESGTDTGEHSETAGATDERTRSGNASEQREHVQSGNGSEQREHLRTGRAYGNIGVTTSDQMLVAFRDQVRNFNIYDVIISEFKQRFCLLVY